MYIFIYNNDIDILTNKIELISKLNSLLNKEENQSSFITSIMEEIDLFSYYKRKISETEKIIIIKSSIK